MDPNQQNQNQAPLTTDYLDQIAVAPKQSEGPSIKKILIFGGIGIVAVLTLFFVLSSLTSNSISNTSRLAGKLYATNNVVSSSIKNKQIKDSKLRALNSTLSLTLENIIKETTSGFAAKGIKMEKMKENKKILAVENSAEIEAILEEARLNGNFDEVYIIEMTHAITSLQLLMEQVSKDNISVEMRAALIKGVDDLTPLLEQFEALNTSTRSAV